MPRHVLLQISKDEIDQYFAKLGYSVGLSLFNFDPPPQQKNRSSRTEKGQLDISEDLKHKNKKETIQTRSSSIAKKMNSVVKMENVLT